MAETKNIIWTSDDEPPHTWTAGILPTITLPDEATQRAGFYSEHAYLLIKNHEGYKEFRAKAEVT